MNVAVHQKEKNEKDRRQAPDFKEAACCGSKGGMAIKWFVRGEYPG